MSRTSKLLLAGGVSVFLAAGCYMPPSAGDLSRINIGMSKSSVTSYLGAPSYATGEEDEEVYHYRFVPGGQPFGKTEGYYVRIVGGNVESYGKEPQPAPADQPAP